MQNTLAALRQVRGLTQEALAIELGVSRQTVISIERGRFDPSLPLALRMSAFFETTVNEMFIPSDNQGSDSRG
jgi:putative transcriptional regulator